MLHVDAEFGPSDGNFAPGGPCRTLDGRGHSDASDVPRGMDHVDPFQAPLRHPVHSGQPPPHPAVAPGPNLESRSSSRERPDPKHHSDLGAELRLMRDEFHRSLAALQSGVERTVLQEFNRSMGEFQSGVQGAVLEEIQAIKGAVAEILSAVQQARTELATEVREDLSTSVASLCQDFGQHADRVHADCGELLEEVLRSGAEAARAAQGAEAQSSSTEAHAQQAWDAVAALEGSVQEISAKQEDILAEITGPLQASLHEKVAADLQDMLEEIGRLRAVHALDSADICEEFQSSMERFVQQQAESQEADRQAGRGSEQGEQHPRQLPEPSAPEVDLGPVLDAIGKLDPSAHLEQIRDELRQSQTHLQTQLGLEIAGVQAKILSSKDKVIERVDGIQAAIVLPEVDHGPVLRAIEKIDVSSGFEQLSSNHEAILGQIAQLSPPATGSLPEVLAEIERSSAHVVEEVRKNHMPEEQLREVVQRVVKDTLMDFDVGTPGQAPIVVTEFAEILEEIQRSTDEIVREVQSIDVREAHVRQLAQEVQSIGAQRSLEPSDVPRQEPNWQQVLEGIQGASVEIAAMHESMDSIAVAAQRAVDAKAAGATLGADSDFANILLEHIQSSKADIVEEVRMVGMRESELLRAFEAAASMKPKKYNVDIEPVKQALADHKVPADAKDGGKVMEELRKAKAMHQNNFSMILNRIAETHNGVVALAHMLQPRAQVEPGRGYAAGDEYPYAVNKHVYLGQLMM